MLTTTLLSALLFVTPAPSLKDADTVLTIEKSLWEAWKHHDLATIKKLSWPDYECVSEDGPEKALSFAKIVETFDTYDLVSYATTPMVAKRLGPDTFILTYNATFEGTIEGKPVKRHVAEGSLVVRKNGVWKAAFLHEITLPETAPK